MATYDHQEQETIDALKEWWTENGTLVLLAAAAFVISVAGVQGWRYYKKSQSEQAAQAYAAVQEAAAGRDLKKIRDAAAAVTDNFSATAYAPRAALIAARASAEGGDLQSARLQLQWVLDHASEAELKDVAQLRLAGVLLDEKKHDEALRLLDAKRGDSFEALYQDLRGDILTAQGKTAEARAAYRKALEILERASPYRAVVQAKLDGLGAEK
ncbi:MAG: tetratricopeptide repeat protein [Betaproteobacteria bacterium]|nr:tetratricopeptide repeat protein [Betaproteobacteria bacterium]